MDLPGGFRRPSPSPQAVLLVKASVRAAVEQNFRVVHPRMVRPEYTVYPLRRERYCQCVVD